MYQKQCIVVVSNVFVFGLSGALKTVYELLSKRLESPRDIRPRTQKGDAEKTMISSPCGSLYRSQALGSFRGSIFITRPLTKRIPNFYKQTLGASGPEEWTIPKLKDARQLF